MAWFLSLRYALCAIALCGHKDCVDSPWPPGKERVHASACTASQQEQWPTGPTSGTRCDLILVQDRQYPVLAVQFELLQAFPFDFLCTRHKPQIIICCQLLLILFVFLKQATKFDIVPLNLLNQ